jgi:hypothetical protein
VHFNFYYNKFSLSRFLSTLEYHLGRDAVYKSIIFILIRKQETQKTNDFISGKFPSVSDKIDKFIRIEK